MSHCDWVTQPTLLTPVEWVGDIAVKRDDKYSIAGINGGKARTCYYLSTKPATLKGIVTAGARSSPQANIVARVARYLGVPCRIHMPSGQLGEQALLAKGAGATIIQHKPGYNSVIIKRARDDALERGWLEIPFGMECAEAVHQTSYQVRSIHGLQIDRIVVPVGSGMTLCGITHGLEWLHITDIPVLGVIVGADPTRRLDFYGPFSWRQKVRLVKSDLPYSCSAQETQLGGINLDPVYEAKCLPFLQGGDLLWVVGSRNRLSEVTT